MTLTSELLQSFADIVTPDKASATANTVYGEVISIDNETGQVMVKLDGAPSGVLTPVAYAANVNEGDRVLVLLKNRQATITGNLTSPMGEPAGYQILVQNVSNHIGNTGIHKSLTQILEAIYPVGSVYIQFGVDLDGPETLLGIGTWQEILTQAEGQSENTPRYHMWVRTE